LPLDCVAVELWRQTCRSALARDLARSASKIKRPGCTDTPHASVFTAGPRQIAGKRAPTPSGQKRGCASHTACIGFTAGARQIAGKRAPTPSGQKRGCASHTACTGFTSGPRQIAGQATLLRPPGRSEVVPVTPHASVSLPVPDRSRASALLRPPGRSEIVPVTPHASVLLPVPGRSRDKPRSYALRAVAWVMLGMIGTPWKQKRAGGEDRDAKKAVILE
jgi:hypothetical protein